LNNPANSDTAIENKNNIDFIYLIGVFYRYWKILFLVTFITGIVSIIYVLVATPIYQSVISMYPVTKDQGGPLKELAVTLGMVSKNDGFYLNEVLKSRRISKKIIYRKYYIESKKDSMDLIGYFGLNEMNVSETRKFEAALRSLKGSVEIKDDKETGLVNITVLSQDMKLCQDIAKSYTTAVTEYLQDEQKNQIKQSIEFSANRLIEVREELLNAEDELIKFQETNTQVGSPALSVELKRKYKKVELVQNVVILLEKQLELLKIEEVRERPVINILDEADIYDKPVKPQKRKVVMANTFGMFVLSYLFMILKEKAKHYNIAGLIKMEFNKPKA